MILFDFEFRNKYEKNDIVMVSFFDSHNDTSYNFRGSQLEEIKKFVEDRKEEYFLCFVANADLPCLLTCGIDVRKIKFIDIYLLYLQLAYTHTKYYTERPSLVNALEAFDLDGGYGENEKEDTVTMILGQTVYSVNQWKTIEAYCEKDAKALAPLAGKLFQELANLTGVSMVDIFDIAEYHGEYLTAVAHADYYNQGFPVNEKRLNDVYGNIKMVKENLAVDANRVYCGHEHPPIYVHDYVKHRNGTVTNKHTFNNEGFTELIKRTGLYDTWEKTATGKLTTKGDYIEAQLKGAPSLMQLYRTRKTFQDLNDKKDLREWCVKGYVKAKPTDFWMSKPYGTKTFRNSPMPAKGFILNKTPWMRVALIEPKKGMAIVSCDWAAQEIAISAALSKDRRLRDLYNQKRMGGDIYLYMAQKAGSAPEGATKETHGAIRDMFKVVLLGLSYGMGITTLGASLYKSRFIDGEPTISMAAAVIRAEEITAWHKSYFHVFWEWVEAERSLARTRGYIRTLDGLIHFVNRASKSTALQNYPVQSAAAVMMRAAFRELVEEDLDIICSHHDAFYISCKAGVAERVAKTLEDCMDKASDIAIGDFCPVLCEAKIQNHGKWFKDERADDALKIIAPLFNWVQDNNKKC